MTTDGTGLLDLAARRLGGGVVAASDEWFADKENLLAPGPPTFDPQAFGHKGKIMDGWETRRRREPGHDWALVRLGAPGVVHSVVIDTSHFTGNYPESASVEGCAFDGYPSPSELCADDVEWLELVPRTLLRGDAENRVCVHCDRRITHVRLRIYPDGGVARLRVFGDVVPDPRELSGAPLDLAAQENGGLAIDCSDRFYSSPHNLNASGLPANMGEGWETRRRRGEGNDWVVLRLAAAGTVRQAIVDTTYFLGNAPAAFALSGCDVAESDLDDPGAWHVLLPRMRLQPDTRHRFAVAAERPVTHVRIDVFPDGGLARLRLFGELTDSGRSRLALRWFDAVSAQQAARALQKAGVSPEQALRIAASRPVEDRAGLDRLLSDGDLAADAAAAVRRLLGR
jgi:allantoicase